jgi:hypothetical protein
VLIIPLANGNTEILVLLGVHGAQPALDAGHFRMRHFREGTPRALVDNARAVSCDSVQAADNETLVLYENLMV